MDEVVARARAMIGVRFRPQGRSAVQGLDCMGLAAVAMGVPADRVRGDYRLSSGAAEEAHGGFRAAGTVDGGPIGGAIGSNIGRRIDAEIFKPKGRQGPRLGDLSVQTSSYGTQIPKIFGTMRVAGTVIWATDLREERTKSGGGKGQPKTTSYSYSASFAVALSGRPLRAVRRIWADGNLLRGAAGDFKSRT